MKSLPFIALLIVSSCSSNRGQETIPPYDGEKVCSDESLAYLKKLRPHAGPLKYSIEELRAKTMSLGPSVKDCYQDEMERTNKIYPANLCFVVGYDPQGKMEFFEFSSKEIDMTPAFKKCLAELKTSKELQGLKDLSIAQPFRLHPKR